MKPSFIKYNPEIVYCVLLFLSKVYLISLETQTIQTELTIIMIFKDRHIQQDIFVKEKLIQKRVSSS